MKIIILLLILSISINSFEVQNKQQSEQDNLKYLTSESNSLAFSYTKGALVNDEQIASFKSYSISASTFYGTSALDNLKFIATQMNNAYSLNFNVFFQQNVNVYTNYAITSTYSESYASFGPGFNNVQPQWSYLFFMSRQIKPLSYVFTNNLGQGTGFNATELEAITESVKSNDGPTGNCYCIDSFFRNLVQQISNFANNVICQSGSPTNSYFQVNNDKWIVLRPRNCYYTIWTN